MKVLCIDCGNTRLKWGVRQGDAWIERGAAAFSELKALPGEADRIVACNVAGVPPRLTLEALAANCGKTIEWVRARAEQCGVTNCYEHPEQLGADRWAALIGARAIHGGDCVVVMSGTATTIDMLTADGRFQGGVILPGVTMMRDALAAGTADLPPSAGEYRDLPRNTFDAIASGCLDATLGAVERVFRRLPPGDAFCLLSGGAAGGVSPRLTLPHRVVENLVLEGLAVIAADG
jgi:type III pantothenate kinase